ncbi:IPT/TIG domain-containing protein [Prevotella sp. KH2C16]|nr:IPT/TIG domain-containing protein [Prevotella sp. KH2C16]
MLALAAVGTMFTSCEDEPDKYESTGGHPTVYYIRPAAVASKDSLLVSASMEQMICLVGDNLRSIMELYFNDQKAVLNTSYITDHTLIVTVPKTIPSNVTNKMYMITADKDTIPYDFSVTIPGPSVVSLSNEWAAADEEVTITGDYFLDYENSPLTINVGKNYTVPRENIISITKTAITFRMPADMPQHEEISVTTIYGTTKGSFEYMDDRGMLFDFDNPYPGGSDVLGNNGWHSRPIQSDDTSLSGNYMMLGGPAASMGADGGWNDGDFSFEYWAGNWADPETYAGRPRLNDVADFTDWNNMSLKFEMRVPSSNPWQSGPMQIIFGGPEVISQGNAGVKDIYGATLGGANNTWFHEQGKIGRAIYMPFKASGSYDTGDKWVTVTIPLSSFTLDWDGNDLKKTTFTKPSDFASLNIFMVRGNYDDKTVLPEGADCHPVVQIDNIRVVPNK